MQFLKELIFPSGFMAHGYCYPWTPGLIRPHSIPDSLIALLYFSFPLTLAYLARKRAPAMPGELG